MSSPTPLPSLDVAMRGPGPDLRPTSVRPDLERPEPVRPDLVRPDPARRLGPKPIKAKPRRHGVYAAAWAFSGLIAGTYVFALILRHDGGLLLARSDRDTVEPAAVAKTQADVANLQRSITQIEGDVARIKIEQAQADDREKQLVTRVTTVESRVAQFGEQIASAVAAPSRVAKAPPPPIAESLQAKPATSRIATAAIPAPPAPPPAPAVAPPTPAPAAEAGSAAVLLARGPSVDALRLSWNLLNERHKAALKSMEPRVVEVEPGSYQLVAGPVANPAEALKVCAALKARGVACQAADFRGGAL